MNLHARLGATATALVLLAAGAALAGDAPAGKIPVRTRWKAGDVVSVTSKSHETQVVSPKVEGQEIPSQTTEKDTAYVAVLRCVEADPDGFLTKAVMWFQAWSQQVGDQKDESLKGVHVEMAGRGTARTVRVLTPQAQVSDAAKSWLEDSFGKDDAKEDMEAVMEPTKELSVGEEWSPDMDKIVALASNRLTIDGAKSKATCKVLALDAGMARYSSDIQLSLTAIKGEGNPPLEAAQPGTVTMKGEMTHDRPSGLAGTTVKDTQMKGDFKVPTGGVVGLDFREHAEHVVKAGGDMPAVPASPETK